MESSEHQVEIRTGRREEDGKIRLSIFMREMLALTLEGHGERAPTFLLTIEQARRLQDALAELISLSKERSEEEKTAAQAWEGKERRRLAG